MASARRLRESLAYRRKKEKRESVGGKFGAFGELLVWGEYTMVVDGQFNQIANQSVAGLGGSGDQIDIFPLGVFSIVIFRTIDGRSVAAEVLLIWRKSNILGDASGFSVRERRHRAGFGRRSGESLAHVMLLWLLSGGAQRKGKVGGLDNCN